MIYEFCCNECKLRFDEIRPVSEYANPANCPKCSAEATRVPFPRRVWFAGTSVQDRYFNHALGKVVSDTEAKQIAKERGMIEVGNEDISKHCNVEESNYDDVWKGA